MRKITLVAALIFTALHSNAQLGSDWDWAEISTKATYSPGGRLLTSPPTIQGMFMQQAGSRAV
ncbi:MAG TPA: hypothetical protein VK623_11070 [Flavobacterium sp.]|nr:hypothetical protein [Flavobacterium sp.]